MKRTSIVAWVWARRLVRALAIPSLVGSVLLQLACRDSDWARHDLYGAVSVACPPGWAASREGGAMVFSPRDGRRMSLVAALAPKKGGPIDRDWRTVREGLLAQYRALPGASLIGEKTERRSARSTRSLIVEFDHRGIRYRKEQWVVELARHFAFLDCNAPARSFASVPCERFFDSLEVTP